MIALPTARDTALENANKGLSIAPLLESGEFSTISENLTEADQAIREGRLSDYLEKAADKLPGWGQEIGKNLLITKDTALFQGLNRGIQYGDFIAKAILYDHRLAQGVSKEDALAEVSTAFVNYNLSSGRARDYFEAIGMGWFISYKLRSTRQEPQGKARLAF